MKYKLESYQKSGELTNGKVVKVAYNLLLRSLKNAENEIREGNKEKAGNYLIIAQDIVYELNLALDIDRNPETGERIRRIYDYLFRCLLHANLKKDIQRVEEARGLSKELAEVWNIVLKNEGSSAEDNPHSSKKINGMVGKGAIKKTTTHFYETKSLKEKKRLDIKK